MILTRRSGFTLLELVLVIGILAFVGTGMIVAYEGMGRSAEKGKATFDIGGLDKAVRTYAVANRSQPDEFDSLLVDDGTLAFIMPAKLTGKLAPFTLTADAVSALNAVGITRSWYLDSTAAGFTNDADGVTSIPNRMFDLYQGTSSSRGFGESITLADGTPVAIVESNDIADFGGSAPGHSNRLQDIAGLDATQTHVVVALGIGNQCTLVDKSGEQQATLSEAPTYPSSPKDEYSRYIALYHVGSGADSTNLSYFEKARFLGVIDTFGDWLDEEYAEYTGQKQ